MITFEVMNADVQILSAKERTPEGRITWNTTFYPSGYPALIDHVHDLGLKFGVYSGAGTWQCHPEGPNYLIQASLGKLGRWTISFTLELL